MMGVGKTVVGRCLASCLGADFVDADEEIEAAAGCSIPEIFRLHGEAAFRTAERQVIERLLNDAPRIIALGGGAFMNAQTREVIAARAVSVWLNGDIELLWKRVSRRLERRDDRPMLMTENPRATLEQLIAERDPIYAKADIVIEVSDAPRAETAGAVIEALRQQINQQASQQTGGDDRCRQNSR